MSPLRSAFGNVRGGNQRRRNGRFGGPKLSGGFKRRRRRQMRPKR